MSNLLKIFITVVILTWYYPSNVFGNEIKKDIQTTIHLLDYISRDYTAAVQNGKVINDGEYAEMQEFSDKVIGLIKNSELNDNEKANILAVLKKLKNLIDQKAPHEDITTVAGKSRQDIIEVTGFKTAPLIWPNLKNAEILYVQNCTPCHGVRGAGDGKLAAGLVPAPTNFLNDTLMQLISLKLGTHLCTAVNVSFYRYGENDVCYIEIDPAKTPVYLSQDGRSRFYIRTGNGTRELDLPEAILHLGKEKALYN